jgi:hypothetical protein
MAEALRFMETEIDRPATSGVAGLDDGFELRTASHTPDDGGLTNLYDLSWGKMRAPRAQPSEKGYRDDDFRSPARTSTSWSIGATHPDQQPLWGKPRPRSSPSPSPGALANWISLLDGDIHRRHLPTGSNPCTRSPRT